MQKMLFIMLIAGALSVKLFEEINAKGDLGIDVCSYQKTINWAKVKAAGKKFAILRTTTKNTQMDTSFETNYAGATEQGLEVMGYHYSYEMNPAQGIAAAKNLVAKLNGKKIPIFLDIEWKDQAALGKRAVTEIAKAFIKAMQEMGYECNVYSGKSRYKNGYYADELKEIGAKFWIASWGTNNGSMQEKYRPNVGEIFWQYTSKGRVSGISGDVDLDVRC